MKLLVLSVLMLIQSLNVSAQSKTDFDINGQEITKSLFKGQLSQLSGRIKNQQLDLTLLPTGFFTLGTSLGTSTSILDDDCQLTYGHPWAKTSFAGIVIDGDPYTFESLFELNKSELLFSEDSVSVIYTETGNFKLEFTLKLSGNSVQSNTRFSNLSSSAKTVSPFLVLDPAMGKWGDGSLLADQTRILSETVIGPSLPEILKITERQESPAGLALDLIFPNEKPVDITIQNWRNLYENKTTNQNQLLYDLSLKVSWGLSLLNPGESRSTTIQFNVNSPEWGTKTFTRWDLEPFASIQNGLLLPSEIKTTVEISNTGSIPLSSMTLGLSGNGLFNNDTVSSPFTISPGTKVYKNVNLIIPELFDPNTGTPTLSVYQSGLEIEKIKRNYFVPATPVSETGLTVTIDTVIHPSGNELKLFFKAEITESGQVLSTLKPKNIQVFGGQDRIQTFSLEEDTTNGINQIDLVFVLDVTGSMTDEIASVKNNIIEFADSLKAKNADVRLGMVTFGDEIRGVYPFTRDVLAFQTLVGSQNAVGGDDLPENSLDALARASEMPFRPLAKRLFIWITDAYYHQNNHITSLTVQQVVNQLLAQTIVVNCIGEKDFQTIGYDPITLPTGGSFYDIEGKFRDILLDISRLTTSSRYVLSFTSPTPVTTGYSGEIKIFYGGLGGKATFTVTGSQSAFRPSSISLYPNPFNPTTTIRVYNQEALEGQLKIYNLLGQLVKTFHFLSDQAEISVQWNGSGENGKILSSGIYFIRAEFTDRNSRIIRQQTAKVYFVK